MVSFLTSYRACRRSPLLHVGFPDRPPSAASERYRFARDNGRVIGADAMGPAGCEHVNAKPAGAIPLATGARVITGPAAAAIGPPAGAAARVSAVTAETTR